MAVGKVRVAWVAQGLCGADWVALVGVAMLVMLVWFAVALVFRWRFQLSTPLRMVRLAVLALPVCWLAVEANRACDQSNAVGVIQMLGRDVDYQWEVDGTGRKTALAESPGQERLGNRLGDTFFSDVYRLTIVANPYTGDALQMLKRLPELKELCIAGHQVTDATLENLPGMHQLRTLVLTDTDVTDAGVAKLQKALPNCRITR